MGMLLVEKFLEETEQFYLSFKIKVKWSNLSFNDTYFDIKECYKKDAKDH